MAQEVLLPRQGNSVESCIIVEWKVAPGEHVAKGDVLVEVETDKATMEVESTAEGVLLEQLVAPGDDVPVLDAIAVVGQAGEKVESAGKADEAAESKPAPVEPPAAAPESTAREPRASREQAAAPPQTPTQDTRARRRRGGAKISPRARKLAETKGVDYEALSGSGPGGRIMVRDIEAAPSRAAGQAVAAGPAAGPARPAGPVQPVSETPIKGVRKLIAERMHASIASTAQLTMDGSADARAILAYRKRLKAADPAQPRGDTVGLNEISINDLVLFAISRVLPRFPSLNATFSEGVIRTFDAVDLGFAVDTPKGLMVPVIRAADRHSLVDLATEAHRLAQGCLEGGVSPDELSGGTFTVTNLGAYGVERFTPVLNAPQVGIMGICAVTPRPAPEGEGTIPMMGLSLTIDHQVVDGAPAARFLQSVARAIAQIDLTLAE